MNANDIRVLNLMFDTICKMSVVVGEVASHNCYGRDKLGTSLSELRKAMNDLNKPPVVITSDQVCALREQTGEGMMSCKKALLKCDGDITRAIDYLRVEGNISFCTDRNRPALGTKLCP